MRLQLTVQRHLLPPVHVLWTVGVLRPPYAAAGTTATIAQLLEQINEIIPLESEDWGLEDYAVEVRGFECLHFSELNHILKEDDDVCVRPLQTADLRFRKVSGRHQIAADGRHLIDGVAFGRPFLRRTDRPAIRIPPRKRRRVTFDDDDRNLNSNLDDRQLMLQSRSNGVDSTMAESDSENDENFSLDEGELNDLTTELADIYNDEPENSLAAAFAERTTNLDGIEEIPGRLTRSRQAKQGLGIQNSAMLELVDENGRPYPEEYSNPLLDLFENDDPPQSNQSRIARDKIKPILNHRRQDENAIQVYQENPDPPSRRSSIASMKNVRFEDAESTTPAIIRDIDNAEHSEDEDLESGSGMDESDKENSEPQIEAYEPSASPSNETPSSSSILSEMEYDNEETSSSSSSSASNTSDSEPEQLPSTSNGQEKILKSPAQSSPNGGGSFSEPKRPNEISDGTGVVESTNHPDSAKSTTQISRLTEEPNLQHAQNSSLPFAGKNTTRKRNQRRRDTRRMKFLKSKGVLAPNATLLDYQQQKEAEESMEESKPDLAESDTDLRLRRDALLRSITSGIEDDLSEREDSTNAIVIGASIDDQVAETESESALLVNESNNMQGIELDTNREKPAILNETVITDQVASQSSKPRSKLDIASSRRLLFGSLGLRTPKTKEEEWNVRVKLMKDIKPLVESNSPKNDDTGESYSNAEHVEDESWKNQIVLKAVECCHDGVELSTPPFPFVQRWDPQQHRGYKGDNGWKNQRSKKRKRKAECFTQKISRYKSEDGSPIIYALAPFGAEEILEESHVNPSDNSLPQIDSRRESDEYESAINSQIMRETASISAPATISIAEDLPILSEDVSTYTVLTKEASLPGAIVAFKQLDMSQETNWQPRVSEYRTALVERLMDNGVLRMKLAQRDQPQIQKTYDQETGERIYSKFEMPGFNDEETLEQGVIELSFAELIEPKLIEPARAQSIRDDWQHLSRARDPTKEVSPIESKEISTALPNGLFNGITADKGREGLRTEIAGLIKDAGWRSSILSHIDAEKQSDDQLSPDDQVDDTISEPRYQSPRYQSSPSFIPFSSSPLSGERTGTQLTQGLASNQVSSPPSHFEIAESLPQRILESQSLLKHSPNHSNDDVKLEDADEGLYMSESHHKSDLPEADDQVSSQKLASQASPCPSVVQSGTSDLKHEPMMSLDGASSDDEFPMIEDVFSQIRSSYESSLEANGDSTYVASPSFGTTVSKDEPVISPPTRRVKPNCKENSSQKQTLFQWGESGGEDNQTTPHASQAPLQSQIVDLTLSSDPADGADSDYVDYGTQLPKGPGWVQKTRAGVGCSERGRNGLGRSRQTRSTSYGALS